MENTPQEAITKLIKEEYHQQTKEILEKYKEDIISHAENNQPDNGVSYFQDITASILYCIATGSPANNPVIPNDIYSTVGEEIHAIGDAKSNINDMYDKSSISTRRTYE